MVAAAIDAVLGFGLALVLSGTVGDFFAGRAVVTLHIGQPGTLWIGPIPMVLGIFSEVTYGLPFAFLLAWSLDPLTGATLGKRLLRLRVRRTDGLPARRSRLLLRSAIQTVGLWGWTLALLAGSWQLAVAASAGALIVLAGIPIALGPGSRTLHDLLSGTTVRRLR